MYSAKKTNLLKATPFSLFFNVILTQTKHRKKGVGCIKHKRSHRKKGVEVQRDKAEEETNRKIRVKDKYVFSCMCFFNGVCREIEGV